MLQPLFFSKSKPRRVQIGNILKSINDLFFFDNDANKNDLIIILMASHTFRTGLDCRSWEALGLVWPTSALTGNQTRAFVSPSVFKSFLWCLQSYMTCCSWPDRPTISGLFLSRAQGQRSDCWLQGRCLDSVEATSEPHQEPNVEMAFINSVPSIKNWEEHDTFFIINHRSFWILKLS